MWPFRQGSNEPRSLDGLARIVAAYAAERRYRVGREDRDGRLKFHIHVPTKRVVELGLDGEVFTLTFPGGYRWGDFAQEPEEAHGVLTQLLTFIDSYSDPATFEVDMPRKLRPARPELRMSNGRCCGPRAGARDRHRTASDGSSPPSRVPRHRRRCV